MGNSSVKFLLWITLLFVFGVSYGNISPRNNITKHEKRTIGDCNATANGTIQQPYAGSIISSNVPRAPLRNHNKTYIAHHGVNGTMLIGSVDGIFLASNASVIAFLAKNHRNYPNNQTIVDEYFKRYGNHSDKRFIGDPYCNSYWTTWFDQYSWGYWYQSWKQIGNCYYCQECSWGASASAGVTFDYTVTVGVDVGGFASMQFGMDWGQQFSTSQTFTCTWDQQDSYGCNSVWFQPQMSWHYGEGYGQTVNYCSGVYWYTNNQQGTYNNVNQPILDSNGRAYGNWGCGSACQASNNPCSGQGYQCCYGNNGGSLGW